jgi:hypothetical protein
MDPLMVEVAEATDCMGIESRAQSIPLEEVMADDSGTRAVGIYTDTVFYGDYFLD